MTATASGVGYGRVAYRSAPIQENSGSPTYVADVPAKIESLSFDVAIGDTITTTTITLTLADWSPGEPLTLSSPTGDKVDVVRLNARADDGRSIGSDGWRHVGTPGLGERDESYLVLVPQTLPAPSQVSVSLRNGSLSHSSQYRFVRTARIDVAGERGSAASAGGTVSVHTGAYKVDRFETDGVSRPGESEGSITRYSLTSSRVPGANEDRLPVPAVSIDLVDVERERTREPDLLVLGAVLGMAGALVIEILLTTAYLSTSRASAARDS
ncbi:hypothetical protein ACN26Y_21100 [Micromonospora sp. WMMD558]|uniref:hypothetical protein n=1 Tax=Micromonospora sp. WMMD558 TaxID=3403462 RepID=UPI003BF51DF5